MLACPVCGSDGLVKRQLDANFLRDSVADFLGASKPNQVSWRDYQLCECTECSLQYSSPMLPAQDDLYEWLDANGEYYPPERWEWSVVEEMVAKAAEERAISVLEFGAGAGFLLRRLKKLGANKVVAVERSKMAVDRLKSAGIEAVEAELAETTLAGTSFDFVISFHCLEHVEDPLGFMVQQRQFAGRLGRVLVSVPYSPMHFETRMFDPLNHPPHHMTRWNAKSLNKLAEVMGEQVALYSPKPFSLAKRVKHAVACESLGPWLHKHPRWRRWLSLLRPAAIVVEIYRQMKRDKINGRVAGDVVLAELTRKSCDGA